MAGELTGATPTVLELGAIAARLALAGFLSGIIGLEREVKDRPAGMRTYMMTAVAAALFAIITLEISYTLTEEETIVADPLRVVEAITAGVAFLAAGTIIMRGRRVTGLTTGAGMWLSGAVGLACGLGLYAIAALATLVALFILIGVRAFENLLPKKAHERQKKKKEGPPDGRPE